jgi:hypothetical protein
MTKNQLDSIEKRRDELLRRKMELALHLERLIQKKSSIISIIPQLSKKDKFRLEKLKGTAEKFGYILEKKNASNILYIERESKNIKEILDKVNADLCLLEQDIKRLN